jgi:hypothetical protein
VFSLTSGGYLAADVTHRVLFQQITPSISCPLTSSYPLHVEMRARKARSVNKWAKIAPDLAKL